MKIKTRKNRSGEAVFVMHYQDPFTGKRKESTLRGVYDKRDAEAVAAQLFGDIVRRARLGEAAGPSLAERTLTVSALLEADGKRAGIAPWTRRIESCHAKPLVRLLGGLLVKNLTTLDVERYKAARESEGAKPDTIRLGLRILKAAVNRAVKSGMLSRKPPAEIALPSPSPSPGRALNRSEAVALLDACRVVGIYAPVCLMLNLGLRKGEVYSLRWRNVDFASATVTVTNHKRGARGAVTRSTLPLNPAALDCLEALAAAAGGSPDPGALVVGIAPEARRPRGRWRKPTGTKEGVPVTFDHQIGKKLKRAASLAGIANPERLRVHDLRHTFVSNLVAAGATVAETRELARHSSPQITLAVYAHAAKDGVREAVNRLSFTAPERIEALG